jgi:protein subunit release factor B
VFSLEPAAAVVRIDPEEVTMQAIRAGGPGGQH